MAPHKLGKKYVDIILSLSKDIAGLGPACDGLLSIQSDYKLVKSGKMKRVTYTTTKPKTLLAKLKKFASLVNDIVDVNELTRSKKWSELEEFIEAHASEIEGMIMN